MNIERQMQVLNNLKKAHDDAGVEFKPVFYRKWEEMVKKIADQIRQDYGNCGKNKAKL
jgi:cyclopropane fatty-acyl-phospholipid synthase-like methyltransferase